MTGVILTGLPFWIEYLIAAVFVVYLIIAAGICLARSGHSPLWALLLLLPYIQIVAVWAFALIQWPKAKEKKKR